MSDTKRSLLTQVGQPFSVRVSAKTRPSHAVYKCECGVQKVLRCSTVKSGQIKACGCQRRKFGTVDNRIRTSWDAMRTRCYNRNRQRFYNYGGRGITICERWQNSVEAFALDMGPRPEGMTIERIDNNGNYCPENCRWATPKEQARNRRTTVFLTVDGVRQPLQQWAEQVSVNYETVSGRYKSGWPDRECVYGRGEKQCET